MIVYILISAIAFLLLFFAIKKYTLNLDEKTLLEPIRADIYPEFCDYINEELRLIKTGIIDGKMILKTDNEKENFLEQLSDMSRELNHIQTMNLSKKDNQSWENTIFNFLQKVENLNEKYLQDSEKINDSMRNSLQDCFYKLKNH